MGLVKGSSCHNDVPDFTKHFYRKPSLTESLKFGKKKKKAVLWGKQQHLTVTMMVRLGFSTVLFGK